MALEELGLSEEQLASVNAEIAGLKAKNEQLLTEKANSKEKTILAEKAAEDARAAATKAHEDKLKQDGDIDALKSHFESQMAEATAAANTKAEEAQSSLTKMYSSSALNSALSIVHDDFKDVSSAMLSNMIKISYNENNEPVTTYESNGEVVASNADEFQSWAKEQPSFKSILKGVNSSGAGASRSASGSTQQDSRANKIAEINKKFNK